MKGAKRPVLLSLAAVFATCACASSAALADSASQQKNKNMWRNLTIGAGVVGLHGLITGHSTETLLGLGGAAYSANRYEQDRHHQSQANDWRMRYHRNYRHYTQPYTTGQTQRYYYRSNEVKDYGAYPNIRYFKQNGHVYYEDMTTGEDYLVRW